MQIVGMVVAAAMFWMVEVSVAEAQSANAPAQESAVDGRAVPWQLGFQEPASPVMEQLNDLHDALNILIFAVSLFVLALLVIVCLRYNRKVNPNPSKFSHNTFIEIVWTAIPVIIFVLIAIPSLRLLYYMDKAPDADMTLKVIGHQWYWEYEYPDHGGFRFDSYMKEDGDLKPGEPRLLTVDNAIYVPVDTTVRVLISSVDVNHNWAVPAFGVKMDAIPGQVNETWFKATREGTFYGQCSELCGVRHGFMPIEVRVVSREKFEQWVNRAQNEFGAVETPATLQVATR